MPASSGSSSMQAARRQLTCGSYVVVVSLGISMPCATATPSAFMRTSPNSVASMTTPVLAFASVKLSSVLVKYSESAAAYQSGSAADSRRSHPLGCAAVGVRWTAVTDVTRPDAASRATPVTAVLRKVWMLGRAASSCSSQSTAQLGGKHLVLTVQPPGLVDAFPNLGDSSSSPKALGTLAGKCCQLDPKSMADVALAVAWPPGQSVMSV